jgi:hypothetical protein
MESEAENILISLRGNSDVKHELDDMKDEANMERNVEKYSILKLFSTKGLLMPTIISIIMHLSQQLSGINAVSK